MNNIELGRRNYHYLLSNLVLEDSWETSVPEYGAINVTGFKLFDEDRSEASRSFLRRWRSEVGADKPVPAVAVLAYDTVSVLEAAFASLLTQKPGLFRPPQAGGDGKFSRKGPLMCDMNLDPDKRRPWEHGAAIARALRSVHLPNGLSGSIKFDEDGRRVDFSLDIMEMTPESKLVKVGTWGDAEGLTMDSQSFPHRGFLPKHRNN